MRAHVRSFLVALVSAVAAADGHAAEPSSYVKPKPNSVDEPTAARLSLAKAGEFLDAASVTWTRERKCGACHTNYPYVLARPMLKGTASPALKEVHGFFLTRASKWDSGEKADKPRWDTEVVATAITLAVYDAQTTGKLHPETRRALDRMWTLQKPNGAWNWLKCNWPPMEHDDYFGAVYVALGMGLTPGCYAETEAAEQGLTKLRKYFQETPAPTLHHRAWLLWASLKLEGLMTKEEQESTIKQLRAIQRSDGGWSLPSLGDWKGNDGRANDLTSPSDGYATALIIYILRQTGTPTDDPAIQKGVAWLKSNQRESGRWFTRSLNSDRYHFITHAGTAFAVMALRSCGVED